MKISVNKFTSWTTFGTLVGAVLGLFMGWVYGPIMIKVAWLGDLFLNALKFIVLPLIISAMISGVASLGDVRRMMRLGGMTIFYFLITTAISVLIGIILVLSINPGKGVPVYNNEVPQNLMAMAQFNFGDFILSFLGGLRESGQYSSNIFYSLVHMEMMPIVLFSLVFGIVLTTVGESGRVVVQFFSGIFEVIMKMVQGIILFAPIGVFGLVAGKVGSLGGGELILQELSRVAMYSLTVIAGLFIHGLIILPALLYFVGRRNPFEYAKGMAESLLTAFSTASSAATLPLTVKNVLGNKVSEKTANFVLPVGATLNMDGTALYEGVAVIFIAQTLGISLSFPQLFLVFILSIFAGVAAAAIPHAGLVTMVVILKALNLPIEGLGLILAVDWFLDRCRTTVNVWGDSIGAAVLDKYYKSSTVNLEAL